MPTCNGIDLRALFDRAMDTRTMRDALGDAWEHVASTTDIEVTRRRSRYFGRALGWWMHEARDRAVRSKWDRVMFGFGAGESAPMFTGAYRVARRSRITMNEPACGDAAQTIKTFLHEMTHLAPVQFTGSRVPYHGREFYSTLATLLDELYPESDALTVYRSRRWRMYEYDGAMTAVFRDLGVDYMPGAKPAAFDPATVSAALLPSGAWLADLAIVTGDAARRAEADGWTVETFPKSGKAVLRPPTA